MWKRKYTQDNCAVFEHEILCNEKVNPMIQHLVDHSSKEVGWIVIITDEEDY